jgi:hypothetical protein
MEKSKEGFEHESERETSKRETDQDWSNRLWKMSHWGKEDPQEQTGEEEELWEDW